MKRCVLFADDQIPWPKESESRNELVKKEIIEQKGEQLRQEGKDPEVAFNEDRLWFEGLHNALLVDFDVIPVRSFAEAMERVRDPDKFHVAVIDLSWSGDAGRGTERRDDIGFDLLHLLADQNKQREKRRPVIAFSQNFEKKPELLAKALKLGALPIPKNYTRTKAGKYPGHEALAAAIEYVAGYRGPNAEPSTILDDKTGRTVPDLIYVLSRRTSVAFIIGLVCLGLAILLFLAHLNTSPGDSVKLFGQTLYTKSAEPTAASSSGKPEGPAQAKSAATPVQGMGPGVDAHRQREPAP